MVRCHSTESAISLPTPKNYRFALFQAQRLDIFLFNFKVISRFLFLHIRNGTTFQIRLEHTGLLYSPRPTAKDRKKGVGGVTPQSQEQGYSLSVRHILK